MSSLRLRHLKAFYREVGETLDFHVKRQDLTAWRNGGYRVVTTHFNTCLVSISTPFFLPLSQGTQACSSSSCGPSSTHCAFLVLFSGALTPQTRISLSSHCSRSTLETDSPKSVTSLFSFVMHRKECDGLVTFLILNF